MFDVYDIDESGTISKNELKAVVPSTKNKKEELGVKNEELWVVPSPMKHLTLNR